MDIAILNEPRPEADALAALWTAGDPFNDNAPTVLCDWVKGYDQVLNGQVIKAMHATGFGWNEGQHLHVPTLGALPFDTLLLVGATPPEPRLWRGWANVGSLVRHGLREAEATHVAILIDRIFATGLEDFTAGLCTPQGPEDQHHFEQIHVTGSIDWAKADHDAVVRGARRGRSFAG